MGKISTTYLRIGFCVPCDAHGESLLDVLVMVLAGVSADEAEAEVIDE